jgi:uncharacterized membrane protein
MFKVVYIFSRSQFTPYPAFYWQQQVTFTKLEKTSRISAVQGFVFLWLALLPFILPTQLQADDWDKLWYCGDGLSHDNLVIHSCH